MESGEWREEGREERQILYLLQMVTEQLLSFLFNLQPGTSRKARNNSMCVVGLRQHACEDQDSELVLGELCGASKRKAFFQSSLIHNVFMFYIFMIADILDEYLC